MKPKILIIWPLTDKVCCPLQRTDWQNGSFSVAFQRIRPKSRNFGLPDGLGLEADVLEEVICPECVVSGVDYDLWMAE